MEDRYLRGYHVSVKSFLNGVRWRTEVRVRAVKDRAAAEVSISPPPVYWSAASEDEADRYGIEMARAWIARQLE
jgi:hypothetical protein